MRRAVPLAYGRWLLITLDRHAARKQQRAEAQRKAREEQAAVAFVEAMLKEKKYNPTSLQNAITYLEQ